MACQTTSGYCIRSRSRVADHRSRCIPGLAGDRGKPAVAFRVASRNNPVPEGSLARSSRWGSCAATSRAPCLCANVVTYCGAATYDKMIRARGSRSSCANRASPRRHVPGVIKSFGGTGGSGIFLRNPGVLRAIAVASGLNQGVSGSADRSHEGWDVLPRAKTKAARYNAESNTGGAR
jgi:hypothetical protein